MRNIFNSKTRVTLANKAFHAMTAGIVTVMAGSVYVKGYKDCQESFESNQWAKGNPQAYDVRKSSNQLKQLLGLKNFNMKASLDTIMKLEDEVYAMGLCVNADIVRENKASSEPRDTSIPNPPSPYDSPSGAP